MAKFKVKLKETLIYCIEVEAADADEAEAAAEEMFVQAEDTNVFFSHVEDRDAADVEEIIGERDNG